MRHAFPDSHEAVTIRNFSAEEYGINFGGDPWGFAMLGEAGQRFFVMLN